MNNGISPNTNNELVLAAVAVLISVIIMMLFTNSVTEYANRHIAYRELDSFIS